MLGLCLRIQLLTGIFLAIQYSGDTQLAFIAVSRLGQDVSLGWFLRFLHANGARLFFICLYTHIGRGIYYGRFALFHTWIVGRTIFLLTIGSAFLGYVLPWGQMSFWGASVITSLIQAVPYIGNSLVIWLWGGFAVDNPTLTRFFALHYLLPFIVALARVIHLAILHLSGSSNPLGLRRNIDKSEFHCVFTIKDAVGVLIVLTFLGSVVLLTPVIFSDPENYILANPLVTPVHIQPEWYFLFAYAILRSIPNKLGGVLALVLAVAVLYLFPFIDNGTQKFSLFNLRFKPFLWAYFGCVLLLTWIGARPVEAPYIFIGQTLTCVYFSLLGVIYFSKTLDWWINA